MSRYKPVKNNRIKFATVFFQYGLGTHCPGKGRGMQQTFIQYKADILCICVAVGDEIRSSDKIQKEIFHQKRQEKTGFCHRFCKIGGELSSDYVFPVFFVPS